MLTIAEFENRVEQTKQIDSPYLSPVQIAPLLGWSAHYIRIKAREEPEIFPFQPMTRGNKTTFMKVDVMRWCQKYLRDLKEAS